MNAVGRKVFFNFLPTNFKPIELNTMATESIVLEASYDAILGAIQAHWRDSHPESDIKKVRSDGLCVFVFWDNVHTKIGELRIRKKSENQTVWSAVVARHPTEKEVLIFDKMKFFAGIEGYDTDEIVNGLRDDHPPKAYAVVWFENIRYSDLPENIKASFDIAYDEGMDWWPKPTDAELAAKFLSAQKKLEEAEQSLIQERINKLNNMIEPLEDYLKSEGLWKPAKVIPNSTGELARQSEQTATDTMTKPNAGDPLEKWFNYYQACRNQRIKYTLSDLAKDANLSSGYIRQEHAKYKAEHGDEENT